jgi:hypothetical protein
VNLKGKNPICTFCNAYDRFDPANNLIHEINDNIGPTFKNIHQYNGKYADNLELIEKELEEKFNACKNRGRFEDGGA